MASKPNTVVARLVAEARERAGDATVSDVRIGLRYLGVRLNDDRCGVSYTFRADGDGACGSFRGLRPLAGRRADELLELLGSPNSIEAGVGLACVNALATAGAGDAQPGDILKHLRVGPKDRVVMIGNFAPITDGLRTRCRALEIFDRSPDPDQGVRPAEEAVAALPGCNIALITATAIINHSIDPLLDAAAGCREVALLGASTPLLPEAFASTPVTALFGVLATDPCGLLGCVSEGGGMRQFRPWIRKVHVRL